MPIDHPRHDDDTASMRGTAQYAVKMTNVVKHFRRDGGQVVKAIDDVSLSVAPGEFVVMLGPSGCGKTTLLRSVAGLETPESGEIVVGGRTMFSAEQGIDVAPERRGIGMIFQSYALWPHMSVFDNVAFPLRARKVPKHEIKDRVHRALSSVRVTDLSAQYPGRLSGGQQQRVALARAVVGNQDLVLFDEPLSNVDAKVREQLRLELVTMQAELGFAALYVTHDQQEAMELADRVAVFDSGHVSQFDRPQEIYERPANRAVANFIGKLNEVRGTVLERADTYAVLDSEIGRLRVETRGHHPKVGEDWTVGFRPERCTLMQPNGSGNRVEIIAEMYGGVTTGYLVRTESGYGAHVVQTRRLDDLKGDYEMLVDPNCFVLLPLEKEGGDA